MSELIAIVDTNDKILDYRDKLDVHLKGTLHRAFSIFVFNSKSELMLHRRAFDKYHSPGLWTNTCCSHLPENSEMNKAIHQRLFDEMGFDTDLRYVTKFHYRIDFSNGLTENEIDHIYIGIYDNEPFPNPAEVSDVKWMKLSELRDSIEQYPEDFTYWLKHIIRNHYNDLNSALQLIVRNE